MRMSDVFDGSDRLLYDFNIYPVCSDYDYELRLYDCILYDCILYAVSCKLYAECCMFYDT